jgi:hypothetical protein
MRAQPAERLAPTPGVPSEWDPLSPEAWARMLGMSRLPLFGRNVPARTSGEHAVLLDGRQASFLLSVADGGEVDLDQGPLSWAWSANLLHVVTIDRTRGEMFLRRWDTDRNQRFPLPRRGQGARDLLSQIEGSPGPRAADVVRYLL